MDYYQAIVPSGKGKLGDYVQCTGGPGSGCATGYKSFEPGKTTSLLINTDSKASDWLGAVHPTGFGGGYCMTCAAKPFSVWSPTCPSGYRALGDAIHPGCGGPNVQDYWCVPDRCTMDAVADTYIWQENQQCGSSDEGVILYGIRSPDESQAASGRFFKAAFGDPVAPPPVSGIYVLRNTCAPQPPPPPPPTPPPVSQRLPAGRYHIRWGADTGPNAAYLSLYPEDAIVLFPRARAAEWVYTPGAAGTDSGGLLQIANGGAVLGVLGSRLPATAVGLDASQASSPSNHTWVLSRTSATGPGSIFNIDLKGCVVAQPLGGGQGTTEITNQCGAKQQNWFFEPI